MIRRFAVFFLLLFVVDAKAQTVEDLFDESILHEVRLDIRPSDWAYLKDHFLEDMYFPCNFRWRFNGRNVDMPQIGCRNRGTGSRSPVKPGLRLQIDRYDADRSFLGLKTIVLRNNTQDASMMHERVAFALMRRLGIPAPRSTHTRLYVNGQYAGLYTIVEEVDDVFTRRVYGTSDGYLFKYDYGKDDPAHFFEYLGPDPAKYSPKPFRPESHEDDPKASVLAAMIRTINEAPDSSFEAAVSEYIDLKGFLLHVGAEAFLAEQDGVLGDYGLNNFYLYRLPTSNRFNIIPWDKSNSFFDLDRPAFRHTTTNMLMRRALAFPALKTVFVEAILKSITAAGGPGGWLEQEIARVFSLIRTAGLEDSYKQCDPILSGNLRPCSNAEFEAGAEAMLRFARERAGVIGPELSVELGGGIQPFIVPASGGTSLKIVSVPSTTISAYGRIRPVANSVPGGLVIVERTGMLQDTILPASVPIRSGRIYAESNAQVSTNVSMTNPNSEAAGVTVYFTDMLGRTVSQGAFTIPAGNQISNRRLGSLPFGSPASDAVNGSFTFSSTVPIVVTTTREFFDIRYQRLVSSPAPVFDLANGSVDGQIVPHFVDGAGWTTQLVLMNPSDNTIAGAVQYSVNVTVDGRTGTSFPYSILPRTAIALKTPGGGATVQSGSIRIANAGRSPEVFAILSNSVAGSTVSEASFPAVRAASAFRMYAEDAGPSIRSAVGVTNNSNVPAVVRFDVTTLEGQLVGVGSVTLPANGHGAWFLNEIPQLQTLPSSFRGVVRISSVSSIAVMGLRSRLNDRLEFLMSALPAISEDAGAVTGELIVPFEISPGSPPRVVLYGSGVPSSGLMQFVRDDGSALILAFQP